MRKTTNKKNHSRKNEIRTKMNMSRNCAQIQLNRPFEKSKKKKKKKNRHEIRLNFSSLPHTDPCDHKMPYLMNSNYINMSSIDNPKHKKRKL